MSTRLLEHSIDNYSEALVVIETSETLPSVEQVLDVLISRDVIHKLLRSRINHLWKNHKTLADLDSRLKNKAFVITQAVNLAELRSSFHPTSDAWWWFFESPLPKYWWDKFDRLWNFLSLTFLVISLCILISISTRLLSGAPDAISSILVIIQTSLTPFVIGVVLTKNGKEAMDRFLLHIGIPINFHQEGRLFLSSVFLIIVICFQFSMPLIAKFYFYRGISAYESQQFSKAKSSYERAIKFDPDNLEARFSLGSLFEDLNDFESASREYQFTAEGGIIKGINNLARLYILEDEITEASSLLLNGLELSKKQKIVNIEILYSLNKNLGWARIKQQRYADAEKYLETAIGILENKASAHCLLAISMEKSNQNQEAMQEWEKCVAYADSLNIDEDQWIGEAQKRLTSLNIEKK
ncbi:MAG: tetratricopeptide repeat protein [Cyanobacteria bacterium P01_F01_bin.143]